IIRAGAHSGDPETVRVAVRGLGRLERPSLLPDLLPLLRNPFKEIRAEAANAIGQAFQGLKKSTSNVAPLDAALAALVARLNVEAESDVRGTICETIGRLPYTAQAQAARAEAAILESASRNQSLSDRLGAAQGLFWLARLQHTRPLSAGALA